MISFCYVNDKLKYLEKYGKEWAEEINVINKGGYRKQCCLKTTPNSM